MKARFLIPLLVFVALAVFLGLGLTRDPSRVPSPLVGAPAPAFELSRLQDPGKTLSKADLHGEVWLLNVWASWCVACRDEHEVLLALADSGRVPIYGLNYKDRRADALRWLTALGNPYVASVSDADGAVGMNYGVYGVPETYVIDRNGVIRYKRIGPLTPELLRGTILPLVEKLSG